MKGADAFHRYYRALYGPRWEILREALATAGPHLAWTHTGGCAGDKGGSDGCAGQGFATGIPPADTPVYRLDPASVAVAHLLPLGESNLDLCAAPGGKTLILARRMLDISSAATLLSNERSRERRARLRRVLEEHLPPAVQARVRVTGYDATRWGLYEPGRYDAILADVPCSSERHVLAATQELARWSRSRVRRLATQQFAILAAAIDSLRPGGHVLYATCALTPDENDCVVERALTRRADRVDLVTLEPRLGGQVRTDVTAEATEFGIQILPDRSDGAGPMYCALLRRRTTDHT